MGFKKGWKAYRASKRKRKVSVPAKAKKLHRRVMRRTRKALGRKMKGSTGGGRSMSKDTVFMGMRSNEIVGSMGYAALEPAIDQMTSALTARLPVQFRNADDAAKVVIGLYLRKRSKGMVRGGASAMTAIAMYNLVKGFMPNLARVGGSTAGTGTSW
jgi:hypothetical protein